MASERDEWASSLWEEALSDTPEVRRENARRAEDERRAAEAAAARAEDERRAAEAAAARAENERRAAREAERVAAESRARARALEIESEALERLNAAKRERAELRRTRAAAKRKATSSKDAVNEYLHKLGKSFHRNPSELLIEALALCEQHGFTPVSDEPVVTSRGDSSRLVYSMEDADGTPLAFVWGTYRMPTGRYEITAYLS